MKRIRITIRAKLIMSFLFVVLITGISSLIIGYFFIINNIYKQAKKTINSHLNSTQYIYNEKIDVLQLFIENLASQDHLKKGVYQNNRKLLINTLNDVREKLSLDILNITDAKGSIIVRSSNPSKKRDRVDSDLYIQYVLKNKKSASGSDLMNQDLLLREGNNIAEKALLKIIKTPNSRKIKKDFENKGLVIKSAVPIFYNNKFIGIIYGAQLLNNNNKFVDSIQHIVFKDEKIDNMDVGNATIFLSDIRISTNVKNNDGTRALGTMVSEEVYERVIVNKKIWLDRAFVVNNWYISAYAPIYNINEKVIGILYVGILEEKYNKMKTLSSSYFIIMTIISAVIAVFLSLYLIQSIIDPYRNLIIAAKQITHGNYDSKMPITSNDEIAYLGKTFNKMVEAIHERDKQLKEQTEKKINQSEKLASLGRLASGIAHEINNPLTGILTYSSILDEELKDTKYEEDIQIIINETLRCREIVKRILDFARETKLTKEHVYMNSLIMDTISITEKHVNFQNIKINKIFSEDIPAQYLDVNQMKSVINNLAVNAADAMPEGGTLTIETKVSEDKKTMILVVSDTGTGILPENLKKIFDPFFTTKETGKGTGLGMAVTYGIIKRHNGTIDVKSEVGKGTAFIIKLPV